MDNFITKALFISQVAGGFFLLKVIYEVLPAAAKVPFNCLMASVIAIAVLSGMKGSRK